jgi:DNA-binding Lrp family transcriptional regulator
MDAADRAIVDELQRDGSLSNVELSRRVGLSAPATLQRVRRLKERGVLGATVALASPEALGVGLTCFVEVRIDEHEPDLIRRLSRRLHDDERVLECYQLTGDVDYLLKIVVRDIESLRGFLGGLLAMRGIGRVHTMLGLAEIKNTTVMPNFLED